MRSAPFTLDDCSDRSLSLCHTNNGFFTRVPLRRENGLVFRCDVRRVSFSFYHSTPLLSHTTKSHTPLLPARRPPRVDYTHTHTATHHLSVDARACARDCPLCATEQRVFLSSSLSLTRPKKNNKIIRWTTTCLARGQRCATHAHTHTRACPLHTTRRPLLSSSPTEPLSASTCPLPSPPPRTPDSCEKPEACRAHTHRVRVVSGEERF